VRLRKSPCRNLRQVDLDPASTPERSSFAPRIWKRWAISQDLISDLQALAGPAAGPNGGEIFIDGFTGGRFHRRAPFSKFESIKTLSPRSSTGPDFGRIDNHHQAGPSAIFTGSCNSA